MKRSLINITLITLNVLLCISPVFSQAETADTNKSNNSKPAIENIQLKFNLSGIPNTESIGLNNSQSLWKLEYKLRLTDEKIISDLQSKTYAKYEKSKNPEEKSQWLPKANKKLYKKWKKAGIFIAKGEFLKTQFSLENSLDKTLPITLTSEVKEILSGMETSTTKPSFILSIKGKILTKINPRFTYKKKYNKTFEYPMKWYQDGDSYHLYNTFGMAITLTKENDRIIFDISRM